MPRVLQVIECEASRGKGVEGDPHRRVLQYYTPEGEFLAERDEWREQHESEKRAYDAAIKEVERLAENHSQL